MGFSRDGINRLALTVMLATAGVTGCGGDDDAAPDPPDVASTDDVSSEDDGSGGSAAESGGGDGESTSGSDAGDPGGDDDFPIPAPDDLLLDAFADVGLPQVNQRHLFYEDADFDRVVEFYDDWTSRNGDWSRAEVDGNVSYVRVDDGGVGQIVVQPGFDPGAQADGLVTSVQLVTG